MQIKVCGITQIEQASALDAMGVQFIGFIFYAPSKRYVLEHLTLEALAAFKPKNALKVGVFVNEDLEQVKQIVQIAGLDLVQLHGDENVDYCKSLANYAKIIKVCRVGAMPPLVTNFESVADYILFDTDSALYGGTGNHFNWELLKLTAIQTPYFLSGGIGANDIGGIQVLAETKVGKHLMALDLNSQFETTPGIKNLEKIKTFIDALI